MKVIITESQYNRAIDYYISYLLEPHEVMTSKKYPDSIFWVKDDEVIVEIENSENFWLRIDIWKDISRMFDFGYVETQSVINMWLEQHHNFGELTPGKTLFDEPIVLEQHHNFGELTPDRTPRRKPRRWNNTII